MSCPNTLEKPDDFCIIEVILKDDSVHVVKKISQQFTTMFNNYIGQLLQSVVKTANR